MNEKQSPPQVNYKTPLLYGLLMSVGMLIGFSMSGAKGKLLSFSDNNGIGVGAVEELIREIDAKYLDSLERDDLVDSAIEGVLSNLDPHSDYYSQEELESFNNRMKGYYKGLGIETIFFRDSLVISRVLQDSPAEQNGILQYDRILQINKDTISGNGFTQEDLFTYLHSDLDTIALEIYRKKENSILSKKIVKSRIRLASIPSSYLLNDTVGYIGLKHFTSKIYAEFMENLELLKDSSNMSHLIIDVRDNPGGFLPETTNILSQLIREKDRILVSTKGDKQDLIEYKTNGRAFFPIDKIAVLINRNSASGSEILAGAIQDWDRGVVIGEPSYGKGLVQEQFSLKNGGALKLTVAKYFTPSGKSIQRVWDQNGRYTYKNDSIQSNEFKTLVLERPLKESGGIHPDIEIRNEITILNKDQLSQAGVFISENINIGLSDRFNEVDFDKIDKWVVKNERKIRSAIDYKNGFSKIQNKNIINEFIRQKYGESASIQYSNKNDESINAALEQFSKADIFDVNE